MCLAVIGIEAHPRYALVIAANRDEHYDRPTQPAAWWPEGWLAGRDVSAGGTWLGIDRRGRWALLTNVREPEGKRPHAPSRGALVTTVLQGARSAQDTLASLAASAPEYNGFNLLAGDGPTAAWLSNRHPGVRALPRGTHAISNAALDTPWMKVVETRRRFDAWCAAGESDIEPLFAALGARDVAPDDALPITGLPRERERQLSASFVITPDYGTRASTVIVLSRDGAVLFEERSFGRGGAAIGAVTHRFGTERPGVA